MKTKIKDHIFYHWYVYVIILVMTSLLDWFIVRNITSYKDYEKVSIFIASSSVDKEKMENIIFANADESLKEVNILNYSPIDKDIKTLVQSVGTVDTDIIIMPKDMMIKDYVYINCYRLYEYKEALDNLYNFHYIQYADLDMGIEVYNNETSYSLFSSFITYDNKDEGIEFNNYVMFLNASSNNFKSLIGIGESDNALNALKALLDYEE